MTRSKTLLKSIKENGLLTELRGCMVESKRATPARRVPLNLQDHSPARGTAEKIHRAEKANWSISAGCRSEPEGTFSL
jgi:hypothetical protein